MYHKFLIKCLQTTPSQSMPNFHKILQIHSILKNLAVKYLSALCYNMSTENDMDYNMETDVNITSNVIQYTTSSKLHAIRG